MRGVTGYLDNSGTCLYRHRKAPPIKHLSDGNTFLARLLQYLETPQYLRKQLFPMHPDLKLVGEPVFQTTVYLHYLSISCKYLYVLKC